MKNRIYTFLIMALVGLSLYINLIKLNNLITAFIFYYIVFGLIFPLIDMLFLKKMPIKKIPAYLRITPIKKRLWLQGLAIGSGMTFIMYIAFFFLNTFFLKDNTILDTVNQWGVSRDNIILVYVIMLLFNGATEELFWRGYIHKRLEEMSPRPLALGLTALFFGGQHIFVIANLVTNTLTILIFMAAITGAGLIWQILREKTKSLLPCIISHVMVTAGYLSIFYFYILR